MEEVYIYHHLGLGDHIMLNGLVRHLSESYNRTWLFCYPHNSNNIKKMYRDNKSIKLNLFDDNGARNYMKIFNNNKYIIVGHTSDFFSRLDNPKNNKTFDQIFYEDQNIPFEYKWDKFYYERDLEEEKNVYYNILGLNDNSKFIFLHEGNYKSINREISPNIKIIKPDNPNISLFDYLYTIEKAMEVHVVNSSFMNLIDCIQLRNDNLFYHEYSRPNINTTLKLPWKILK